MRNVLVAATQDDVWEVLADGHSYAEWVVGTREVSSVDPEWPQEGARLSYMAGIGPFKLQDQSIVRLCDPPARLELEARLRVLAARVSIEVKPWGHDALVIVDEHSLRGSSLLLENPIVEFLLSLRNRRMLRHLAVVVEGRRQVR